MDTGGKGSCSFITGWPSYKNNFALLISTSGYDRISGKPFLVWAVCSANYLVHTFTFLVIFPSPRLVCFYNHCLLSKWVKSNWVHKVYRNYTYPVLKIIIFDFVGKYTTHRCRLLSKSKSPGIFSRMSDLIINLFKIPGGRYTKGERVSEF